MNCFLLFQEAEFNQLASYQTRTMETPSVKAMTLLDKFLSELTVRLSFLVVGDSQTN